MAAMPLLPEILLACAGLIFLMIGVFVGDRSAKPLAYAVAAALVAVFFIGLMMPAGPAFGGLFISDKLATFAKALIVVGAAATAVMAAARATPGDGSGAVRFEQPVLMLFAALGMMLMVSANDLISLYMGLELQSLSLYVLAAIRRDSLRATEAGLKYFVSGRIVVRHAAVWLLVDLRLYRVHRLRHDCRASSRRTGYEHRPHRRAGVP